jgi:hypothetical protein
MQRLCNRWTGAGLAVLLTAGVGLAQADGTKKTRAAATPEEAVKNYRAAVKAADVQKVLAVLAEPGRSYFRAYLEGQKTQENLAKAIDDKFGKDKKAPPIPTIQDTMKAVKDIRVVGKKNAGKDKDKVELTVWQIYQPVASKGKDLIQEQTWFAVKQKDGWKLALPMRPGPGKKATRKGPDDKEVEVSVLPYDASNEPTAKEIDYFKKTLVKWKQVADKLAKEIKEGKYESRQEALKAWQDVAAKFSKENPPPKRDK